MDIHPSIFVTRRLLRSATSVARVRCVCLLAAFDYCTLTLHANQLIYSFASPTQLDSIISFYLKQMPLLKISNQLTYILLKLSCNLYSDHLEITTVLWKIIAISFKWNVLFIMSKLKIFVTHMGHSYLYWTSVFIEL